MFRSIPLFIGLRYTRAKRRNHFISFISLVSILGITLGVTVLITVLSVMNGFDKELRERILGMAPHIVVSGYAGSLGDWPSLETRIAAFPEIVNVKPFIEGQGMLTHDGRSHFVMLQGLLPEKENENRTLLSQKMLLGALTDLKPGSFGVVLGKRLAANLQAKVGDKVTLVLADAALTPAGLVPRIKRLTVVGIFEVGYEYDSSLAFLHLNDAQKIYRLGDQVTGINATLDNLYSAPRIAKALYQSLGGQYYVYDWTQRNGNFFAAVKLEKTLMFFMLLLIVAVAAFNILSTLVMVVTDKQADIAILRTLGATPGTIMRIFMVQGCVIGVVGTFLGIMGGIALALNVTDLVSLIETTFQVKLLSADVYYISFLPSALHIKDVVIIAGISLLMSFVATLYPAWRASTIQPAEALRYE